VEVEEEVLLGSERVLGLLQFLRFEKPATGSDCEARRRIAAYL